MDKQDEEDFYSEFASIREFDAGYDRSVANALARADLIRFREQGQ